MNLERGRYQNIPRRNRICKLCNTNVIENEYNFLVCCDFYDDISKSYIPRKYYTIPCIQKFNILMSSQNEKIIKCTSSYLV